MRVDWRSPSWPRLFELAKVRRQLFGPPPRDWRLATRGLHATFHRDVIPHGVWFWVYDRCKRTYGDDGMATMASGAVAAAVAWVVGYPADVLKTRIQGESSLNVSISKRPGICYQRSARGRQRSEGAVRPRAEVVEGRAVLCGPPVASGRSGGGWVVRSLHMPRPCSSSPALEERGVVCSLSYFGRQAPPRAWRWVPGRRIAGRALAECPWLHCALYRRFGRLPYRGGAERPGTSSFRLLYASAT